MAKVSIIVPVLNSVEYIRECMDSLVEQTLLDIEIIPVDAGSTDGTIEILKEYAAQDSRIKILLSDKKSMGYQYNIGISEAKGEYIGFCESDDYVSKQMYERLYNIAQNNNLDFVRSDFDMFIDKKERIFLNYHILAGKRTLLYGKIIRPSEHPDIIYRDVNMWNGIYNKKFLENEKIKQNETMGASFQDIGFVIQTFLAAKRAMYVQEDTNKYRRDNISSSIYNLKGIVNVVQEMEFFKEYITHFKEIDEYIYAVILCRFCSLFFGFYGKLPEKSYFTNDINDAISSFVKIVREFYKRISYYAIAFEGLECSLSLNLLLKDLDEFDALRKKIEQIEKESRYKFYEHITNYPKAVIFGAGEMGTATYALLRKNDYEGVSCFCDNDSNKWGKKLMGKEVVSPDKLADLNDGKTVFIIAVVTQIEIIKEQLLSAKIEGKHICRAIHIIPHNAMEVNIKTKGKVE